ncbi:hypothetical protein SAMN06265219_101266 [Gracilimonas mengyeensis]|uniref:Uncharacterized protein n=1 Tax=Gracilimonas mengyeensis TaxID=1302730 RepID=A0A521AN75_9BACT|nr:hypothetical protein SAMN06265219_101266 [Gracilimonas mengyeensis]
MVVVEIDVIIARAVRKRIVWLGMLCEISNFIALSVFHSATKVNPFIKKIDKCLFHKGYGEIGSASMYLQVFKSSEKEILFWVKG